MVIDQELPGTVTDTLSLLKKYVSE